MEEEQREIYLKLFAARRDSLLDLLQREIEGYKRFVVELGLKGKLINQCLLWLQKWENALRDDLEEAGLESRKAHQTLGPILTSQLDTKIHYFDLKDKDTSRTFEWIWANDNSLTEPWQGELSFVVQVPHCLAAGSPQDLHRCAWRFIREGLGLDLDENQRKEE